MVAALDAGVAQVENAYKAAGMWDDTVTIFSMCFVRSISFSAIFPLPANDREHAMCLREQVLTMEASQ